MNSIKLFQNDKGKHVLHLNGLDISSAVSRVVIEVSADGYAVARVDLVGKMDVDIDGLAFEFSYLGERDEQDGQDDE